MNILVDTGAWYAIADSSDRHHPAAAAFYKERIERDTFLTTDLILAETWTLLAAHLSRNAALTFWQSLRETRMPLLTLETGDLEAAWQIMQSFSDQAFSLVDCTTFAVMERLAIHDAFAFDSHFLIYRFGPGRGRAFRRLPG